MAYKEIAAEEDLNCKLEIHFVAACGGGDYYQIHFLRRKRSKVKTEEPIMIKMAAG